MNQEEIMVGDWIMFPNSIEKVQEVSFVEGKGYCASFAASATLFPISIDLLKPIPLTSEILEKNGFAESTPPPGIHARCYELDNKKDRYNLTIADYNKYKRLLLDVDSEDSECFNIKCDYVHELQHALRLCKIDKEIKL